MDGVNVDIVGGQGIGLVEIEENSLLTAFNSRECSNGLEVVIARFVWR